LKPNKKFCQKCKFLEPNKKFYQNCKISKKPVFRVFSELQGQVYWMAAFATATPLRKFFSIPAISATMLRSQFMDKKIPQKL